MVKLASKVKLHRPAVLTYKKATTKSALKKQGLSYSSGHQPSYRTGLRSLNQITY